MSTTSAAIRTLSFFAAQESALTLAELRDFWFSDTDQSPSISQLEKLLPTLPEVAVSRSGLYTLKGKEYLFEQRLIRYVNALKLLRRARIWAVGLRHIPYVRAAAVSGSTAQMNSAVDSDIDLFIIADQGKIYFARLLVSFYFQILGMRRHGELIKKRFCLNHYITSGLVMPQDRNEYTAVLYSSFLTLFGHEYINDFWKKNKFWIQDFISSPQAPEKPSMAVDGSSISQKIIEGILSPFVSILEKIARFFQKNRIHQSDFVIVSDEQLSFHPDSKGQKILAKYREITVEAQS